MTRWSVVAAMVAGLALLPGGAVRAAEKTDKAVADDVWKTTFSDGLLDAAGKAVSPDNLKGKLVAIYFSAHWCPPCKAFTPKRTRNSRACLSRMKANPASLTESD